MHERTSSNSQSDSSKRKPKAGNRTAIPETGETSSAADDVRAFVRENLLASPMFPKLYADVVIASAPDSREAKILAGNYQKIVAYTERNSKPMSTPNCTHIKVSGVRCGSPALRGEQFCYFHQRMHRTVRYPSSRVHHAALLEDEESIQASLVETVNSLLRGTIELKRGELILRALNTAVRNIRRVHFGLHPEHMVREVPNYPIPPLEEVDEQYAAELRRPRSDEEAARQRAATLAQYFGGPERVPENLKPTAPAAAASPASPPADRAEAPPRKPPVSVKAEAPRKRKNAAQGARRG